MNSRFAREKEQILSQYILHHDVADNEVAVLAERLDRAVTLADRLHAGQKRRSGEDYILHPLRTAMEVSRLGRIVDWTSIEASLLHDTLEDTDYTYEEIRQDFPEAADLVEALTKIKDSRELTYQKLFRFVLQDIRVLLVKIADRLDNLETLGVFSREKQIRIASESAQMYANICRRLCMLDLAERLAEKVGEYLMPEEAKGYLLAQAAAKEALSKPLAHLRIKLAELFPGDINSRIEIKWLRYDPEAPPATEPESHLLVRIVTETPEDAYRALGRIHLAFSAIPGAFVDTLSNPRANGYRALETRVSYRGRMIRFYLANRGHDRYNRLGLLSMDIDSPMFNLKYLDDLRDFLQSHDGNIQDFLRFQRPDAIQVVSPSGEIYSLEEGATALDFAFSVHDELGYRATGARINDEAATLDTVLHSGDRITIETAPAPVCDERYLSMAHTRKAQAALKRHMRRVEMERAASTGRQWLVEAAQGEGIAPEEAERLAGELAASRKKPLDSVYRDICFGAVEIGEILGGAASPKSTLSVETIVRMLRPSRPAYERRVRRYDFDDPHIRFCPVCAPVMGDDIEGVPEGGRLNIHRKGCPETPAGARIPLAWDKNREAELRDPGGVELDLTVEASPGVFYAVVGPFKALGLDIQTINMPDEDNVLKLKFAPGTARSLDRLIRALRRLPQVKAIRPLRDVTSDYSPKSPETSSR